MFRTEAHVIHRAQNGKLKLQQRGNAPERLCRTGRRSGSSLVVGAFIGFGIGEGWELKLLTSNGK